MESVHHNEGSSVQLLVAKVMTASDMLGAKRDSPTPSPETFHQGMLVSHPVYGPGSIVALSGSGAKRMATINFFNAGQKKFRLAQSQLTPVKRASESPI